MSALAFFPWLVLKEAVKVRQVRLWQYARGKRPAGEYLDTIDILLEPYVESRGHPIREATLVQVGDRGLLDDVEEAELPEIFDVAAIVTVAGLAARVFFALKYWNSANFQFTVQHFGEPGRGAFIQTRRLDGSQSTYVPHDLLVVARPVHASSDPGVEVDLSLLEALLCVREEDDWPRFRESIQAFNLANSDSMEVPIETAVVLLNGAFERVLDADEGREEDLAARLMAIMSPREDLPVDECARLASPDVQGRFKKARTVRDAWVRDLFRTRGDLAHGRTSGRYPAVWRPYEHLLLGGFLFPLVLKVVLAARGLYELERVDRDGIDAFEALCCEDHFLTSEKHDAGYNWHKVISGASLRRVIEIWADEHPELFGDVDAEEDASGG